MYKPIALSYFILISVCLSSCGSRPLTLPTETIPTVPSIQLKEKIKQQREEHKKFAKKNKIVSLSGPMHLTGHYLEPRQIEALKNKNLTKNEVREQCGSPTLVPHYSPDNWYYIGSTSLRRFWSKPKIVDQVIVRVHFIQDKVASVDVLHNTMHPNVHINPAHTTNPATDRNFIELFKYNFSKIHSKKKAKS